MTPNVYRTHHCAALRADDAGTTVRLSGWIHRKRDHGGVLFVDLRDRFGLTQCVADADSPALAAVESARPETVVRIEGRVVARSADTVNDKLPTGCLLYTSPSPRDRTRSRMPSSA